MGTKESIKKGLEKAGTGYTIKRLAGDISGEFLDFSPNAQVTKPFIREFFIETLMAWDTNVVPGDVLVFAPTDDVYLSMNKTPSALKNVTILNDGVLYKANVSGELLRPSGEVRDADYRMQAEWETISGETGAVCFALQTEPLHGVELQDEELGQIGIENHELYIPTSFEARINDRYQPASGEYYKINSVKTRRFPGIDVLLIEEDTR